MQGKLFTYLINYLYIIICFLFVQCPYFLDFCNLFLFLYFFSCFVCYSCFFDFIVTGRRGRRPLQHLTLIIILIYALFDDPNTSLILCCTVFFTDSLAGVKYFLGSNTDGSSTRTFLISDVIAKRKSVSTFIFDTPDLLAWCSIMSGTPFAPGISPPYLLHFSTSSGITVDAPCNTIGVFGIRVFTSFNMSNLSLASPLNFYAPWLVPIAIAKESQPVLLTNSSA